MRAIDDLRTPFERIRQKALCRKREPDELRSTLLEMRQKMSTEHASNTHLDSRSSPKHCPGGLIDIEFIAQFGVLSSALSFPRVLQATSSLSQLTQLSCIGWLTAQEADLLTEVMRQLSQQRMMAELTPGETSGTPDTQASARLFERFLGRSGQQA